MKDKSILISMGIIIYIVMSGIDRFVYHIPNVIYIPVFLETCTDRQDTCWKA